MPYTKAITRAHPTLVLFLLDHSDSMKASSALDPQMSNAEVLAEAVNRTLSALVRRAVRIEDDEEVIRNYCDIGIIGYSNAESYWAFGGSLHDREELVSLDELARNVERVETREIQYPGPNGEVLTRKAQVPIFVEPMWRGWTPMTHAFQRAVDVVRAWVNDPRHRDSFPPVVINVTDGEPTDGEPLGPSEELRQLQTSDGHALLFNCHLSSFQSDPAMFPASEEDLPREEGARRLFNMSSVIPPNMAAYGRTLDPPVLLQEGARGFLYQANGIQLVRLLDMGTTGVEMEDVMPAPPAR